MIELPLAKKIIIGTQTFGKDTDKNEAFKILDLGFEVGSLRIDTAERYPFPESRKTIGITELIIGDWLRSRSICPSKISIATKVTGRSDNDWFPHGGRLSKKRIEDAVDCSLKRLGVDFIDVYYLHWPDRYTNIFGRKYYSPDHDDVFIPVEEQVYALAGLIDAGKIKSYALSNETPWGLMKFINAAGACSKYKPSYIQNEYSVINRKFEEAMSEVSIRESVPLVAYSPLSFGLLTGKYFDDVDKSDFRLIKHSNPSKRYTTSIAYETAKVVHEVCKEYGVLTAKFSIGYVAHKNFVGGIILGSKNTSQIRELISYMVDPISVDLTKNIYETITTRIDL